MNKYYNFNIQTVAEEKDKQAQGIAKYDCLGNLRREGEKGGEERKRNGGGRCQSYRKCVRDKITEKKTEVDQRWGGGGEGGGIR